MTHVYSTQPSGYVITKTLFISPATTCSVMKSYLQLHVDFMYDLNQLDNMFIQKPQGLQYPHCVRDITRVPLASKSHRYLLNIVYLLYVFRIGCF